MKPSANIEKQFSFEKISDSKASLATNIKRARIIIPGILKLYGYTRHIKRMISSSQKIGVDKPNFDGLCGSFFAKMGPVAREIMNMKVEVHGELPKIDPNNERAIVMTNHPTTDALWPFLEEITKRITPDFIAVGKQEMITKWSHAAPIFGQSMDAAEKYISLTRKDRDKDLRSIETGAQYSKPGSATLIMLDGTRPKATSINYTKRKLGQLGYGKMIEKWNHTSFPKSGGLLALMEAFQSMDNCRTRIINLLVASDQPRHQPYGSTIHIFGQEFESSDIVGNPKNDEEKRENANRNLIQMYYDFNLKIEELQK